MQFAMGRNEPGLIQPVVRIRLLLRAPIIFTGTPQKNYEILFLSFNKADTDWWIRKSHTNGLANPYETYGLTIYIRLMDSSIRIDFMKR